MSTTPPTGPDDRPGSASGGSSDAGDFSAPPSGPDATRQGESSPGSGSSWGAPPPDQSWQNPQNQSFSGEPTGPAKTSGVAIGSLVLGILALLSGFFVIGGLFGIIGLILGIVALRQTKDPAVGGKGLAIGGIVTSVIGILFAGLVLFGAAQLFGDPQFQQILDDAQNDPEALQERLEEMEQDAEAGG